MTTPADLKTLPRRSSRPRATSLGGAARRVDEVGAHPHGVCAIARLALFVLLLALAVGLSACSDNSHTPVTTGTYAGESGQNAPYLNVGPLIYEVQLSRELNPADTEDAAYLVGLRQDQLTLHPGEEWFGVFIQVYNESSSPHRPATDITISDTQGNVYTPIIPSDINEFAYRGGNMLEAAGRSGGLLEPKERIPRPGSVAADGPTQGALLLYRIKVVSLDNRPLKLKIVDPLDPSKTASAELDV